MSLGSRPEHPSRALVRKLLEQGMTTVEIAIESGLSMGQVNRLRKQMGIARPKSPHPTWWKSAMDMYRAGVPLMDIADEHNVSLGHINKVRTWLNLPARSTSRPEHPKNELAFVEAKYKEGWSYTEIAHAAADMFGKKFTRNAIAGLVYRQKWVRGGYGPGRNPRKTENSGSRVA